MIEIFIYQKKQIYFMSKKNLLNLSVTTLVLLSLIYSSIVFIPRINALGVSPVNLNVNVEIGKKNQLNNVIQVYNSIANTIHVIASISSDIYDISNLITLEPTEFDIPAGPGTTQNINLIIDGTNVTKKRVYTGKINFTHIGEKGAVVQLFVDFNLKFYFSGETCSDSDNGKNYYVKGTISGIQCDDWGLNCGYRNSTDICLNDVNVSMITKPSNKLSEMYCEGNLLYSDLYECPYGCKDGVCLQQTTTTTIPTTTCTDSDSGLDYYTKGCVKVCYPNKGGTCVTTCDFCISDGKGSLNERYCGSDNETMQVVYQCPNGCSDGACLKEGVTTTLPYTCIDSDGGYDIYVSGKATGVFWTDTKKEVREYFDYCLSYSGGPKNGILNEVYCEDGLVKAKTVYCDYGCVGGAYEGACSKLKTETCTDSDSGLDYYTKGTVSGIQCDASGNCEDKTYTDICLNDVNDPMINKPSNYVSEMYCDGAKTESKIYSCPNGCKDGACIKTFEPNKEYILRFKVGWNMFSFPVEEQKSIKEILGNGNCEILSKVWHYSNGKYEQIENPVIGYAYWLKMKDDCSVRLTGNKITIDDFSELNVGWNQIGSPSEAINFFHVIGNCNLLSGNWWFNSASNKYEKTQVLRPGEGYWIKVKDKCKLGTEIPPLPPGELSVVSKALKIR
jgi:hypothetical protein